MAATVNGNLEDSLRAYCLQVGMGWAGSFAR